VNLRAASARKEISVLATVGLDEKRIVVDGKLWSKPIDEYRNNPDLSK